MARGGTPEAICLRKAPKGIAKFVMGGFVQYRSTVAAGHGRDLADDGVPTAPSGRDITAASESPIMLSPARYVLLPLAQMVTGYSVKAMQRKIERGDWEEGKVWKHAPDGRVVIDMLGYQRWVEGR
jgi:hypothetical protein